MTTGAEAQQAVSHSVPQSWAFLCTVHFHTSKPWTRWSSWGRYLYEWLLPCSFAPRFEKCMKTQCSKGADSNSGYCLGISCCSKFTAAVEQHRRSSWFHSICSSVLNENSEAVHKHLFGCSVPTRRKSTFYSLEGPGLKLQEIRVFKKTIIIVYCTDPVWKCTLERGVNVLQLPETTEHSCRLCNFLHNRTEITFVNHYIVWC